MKVTLLPSCFSRPGQAPHQNLTSFLIDDFVALDAGSIGLWGSADDQARVKHLFLSHTHIDHLASLPVFVENIFEGKPECVTIYASATVIQSLRADLFNDRIWPDFVELSTVQAPFLKLEVVESGQPVRCGGLAITPVSINHSVPTVGFVVSDGASSVAVVSDTGPTDSIWRVANAAPNLKAVFLEAAFPNRLVDLARKSGHLTPALFGVEASKVTGQPRFLAIHLKARYRDEITGELTALGHPSLEIAQFGIPYVF